MKHSYKKEKTMTIFSDVIIYWLILKEVNLNSDANIVNLDLHINIFLRARREIKHEVFNTRTPSNL